MCDGENVAIDKVVIIITSNRACK